MERKGKERKKKSNGGSLMVSAFIFCILLGPGQGKERTENERLFFFHSTKLIFF